MLPKRTSIGTLISKTIQRFPDFFELLRRTSFRGKSHLVKSILWELPPEVVANCNGFLYRLSLKDDIQYEIYFDVFSNLEMRVLKKLIPSGGICIDVGANVGYYALNFAKCVGDKGRVYAFEPDTKVYNRLLENINLNKLENIISVIPKAVTDKNGKVSFYSSSMLEAVDGDLVRSSYGSLIHFDDIGTEKTVVQATTLDEFMDLNKIPTVDLLKVDVEANEFELIKGAKNSLEAKRFKYIYIEFNGPRQTERGHTFADFLRVFEEVGYKPVLRNLMRLKKPKNDFSNVVTDFIFSPS